jgi:Leucine-rich repeat (LRR) protein
MKTKLLALNTFLLSVFVVGIGFLPSSTAFSEEFSVQLLHYLSYDSGDEKSGSKGYGTGLDLAQTEASDNDLRQLSGKAFQKLRYLSLRGTQVSDDGLKYLKGLPLKTLVLEETEISGSGFDVLRSLPLESLVLEDTDVDDAGLERLKGTSISQLDLTRTRITDEGMVHIREMSVSSLKLYSTQITNAGLQYLEGLPKLKTLFLTGTQVTDDGVDSYKRRNPKVSVIY